MKAVGALLLALLMACGSSPAPKPVPPPVIVEPTPTPPPTLIPTPTPDPPPPVSDTQCDGTFGQPYTFAASYYDAASVDAAVLKPDLGRMARQRICNARVWVDWFQPDESASVFRDDGSVREERMAGLREVVRIAGELRMTVDLTMHSEAYRDVAAHTRAAVRLAEAFRLNPTVAFFDLSNEWTPHESDRWSAVEMGSIARAVRAVDPQRLITVSVDGDLDETIARYTALLPWVEPDLLTPHWLRTADWYEHEGELSDALTEWSRIAAYNQEPQRADYPATYNQEPACECDLAWDPAFDRFGADAYVEAEAKVRASKSLGFCFHTVAGFIASKGSWWDQLIPSERDAVARITGFTA